jgi:drug/metabolite transporter (DMT)-like permease
MDAGYARVREHVSVGCPPVAVLLGVLVAMSFGSADFLGGRASRTAPTLTVLLIGQVVAVTGALVIALVVGADVEGRDLAYGAAAGACNVVGLGLLYQGLATGRMGVVAPVTAVAAAIVPIVWGLVHDERPSVLTWVGAVLAVAAGALVASEPDADDARGRTSGAIVLALTAGVALGASLVLYTQTRDESGFWPVLTARVAAIVLVALAVAVVAMRGGIGWPVGHARNLALGAGALDVTATALLLLAVRNGLTVVVAPVAALAPAFTVMWAWVVLREHVTRHQFVGLGIALTGLVLIAAG